MDDAAPPARDWSLLPLDALASIFVSLSAVEVLMGAGLVCRSWLEAAKLPDVWRVVDMENHHAVHLKGQTVLRAMARAAVDRSHGQLRVFAGKWFVSDELIKYMVERSPLLAFLRLVSCDGIYGLARVLKESPPLELRSLELEDAYLTVEELTAILESCPVLKFLGTPYCCDICDEHKDTLRSKFPWIKITS